MKDRKYFLSPYYYGFQATGVDCIDRILEAISIAGKAYHNTSEWGESSEYDNKKSPTFWELIELKAHEAAKEFQKLTPDAGGADE